MKHTLLLTALLVTFSAPVFAATLCQDGQYHADGACKLCPDGTHTHGATMCVGSRREIHA